MCSSLEIMNDITDKARSVMIYIPTIVKYRVLGKCVWILGPAILHDKIMLVSHVTKYRNLNILFYFFAPIGRTDLMVNKMFTANL